MFVWEKNGVTRQNKQSINTRQSMWAKIVFNITFFLYKHCTFYLKFLYARSIAQIYDEKFKTD